MPTSSKLSGHSGSATRRLAAVLFADMVGYSSQIERDQGHGAEQASKSIRLFKDLIGDYGGTIANVAGDGILSLFDSAAGAARFALFVQSEFRDQAIWREGEPIEFRIGLNVGEVIEEADNVHGHCVNVAARLQSIAEPGTILATEQVRSTIGQADSRLAFTPLGARKLKNMSQPVDVFLMAEHKGEAPQPPRARKSPSGVVTKQPSVAVLALENGSGNAAYDHLCQGIVEDVIANLSRFRNLMVIARHSAFLFSLKSHSAREIGARLGVRYLLTGRLRASGPKLRIGVDLIDAEREGVMWTDTFNIEFGDIFSLQEEIASDVAGRLAVQIDLATGRPEQLPPDMQAYGLVMRGRQLSHLITKPSNAHARRLFEEALEIAPSYGRAFSGLSRTHNLDWRYAWSPSPEQSLEAALELARAAVQNDRLDARAYAELGFAQLYRKRHEEALTEYRRALALNPNDADIIVEYADALVYCGEAETSVELIGKAMRLNPFYPDWYLWYLADAFNALFRPVDVINTVQRMQNPDEGRRMLAANFAHLGMLDKARAEAREVLRIHPQFTISSWRQRPPYRDEAVLHRYVEGMRKAGLPE